MIKSKYGNKKTKRYIKGKNIVFDSIAEATRAVYLADLEKHGVISGLEFQPKYQLQVAFRRNGKWIRALNYIADFRYKKNGKTVVEDVKGVKTAQYTDKRKQFLFNYGANILFFEVYFKKNTFEIVEI